MKSTKKPEVAKKKKDLTVGELVNIFTNHFNHDGHFSVCIINTGSGDVVFRNDNDKLLNMYTSLYVDKFRVFDVWNQEIQIEVIDNQQPVNEKKL